KSKANGLIQKLWVDVNDRVEVGQVIAELDRELLLARVAEAEGKLEQAIADRDLAAAEIERLELERNDPEHTFAERNWERVERLHREGVMSDDERDMARERLERSKYTLRVLDARSAIARARLATAEGRIKEVRALAEIARQELEEATLVSPIDGVVLYRYLEEGDAVSSIRVAGGNASVIMTLGDLSEVYVEGEVDEVDVGRMLNASPRGRDLAARITVESFKDRVFPGRVLRVTPLGLEDSNGIVTFQVRIAIDNPDHLLFANMTANSLIILEERKNVLLLSQGALVSDGGRRYAVVVDPRTGESEKRAVGIGLSDGVQVEVTEGLTGNERVLIP
ncbi:MAG TPA: efflux RND transporter periplasmic adaptor subunit, partial [Planctomycetota bacterium]|nr:efflux RND transporter periplasmic adaptor subunit [Planctomycetota bacterium]